MIQPVSELGVGLQLDLRNQRLRWGRRDIALTPTAFALLGFLATRPNELASNEDILAAVWPGVVVEEGQVRQFVAELRRILHDDPKTPRLIETVRGRGYRFIGDIRILGLAAPRSDAVPARRVPPEPAAGRRAGPLIGREGDLATLAGLVRERDLLTITGPGGVGKTLLSRHVVQQLAGHFGDGIVSLELAPLTDAELLVGALVRAVDLPGRSGDPLESLIASLAPLHLLLVLDNAEHLVDEVARIVQALRDGAPRLHVLVTSQLPLRLAGERVYRLGPLGLPTPGMAPAEVRACGAVALFLARTRAADPAHAVTDADLPAVVGICSRLDGVPLALELAAARLGSLGLQPLAAAIGSSLQLLSTGDRGAPQRQRTLRGALEWTHGLLSPGQQAVFRRLGVFASSFSLATAQQVAGPGPGPLASAEGAEIADAIAALVDCSLLKRDADDPPHYRMLQATRLYARERLAQAPEFRAVRSRQLAHYTALADAAFNRPAAAPGPGAPRRLPDGRLRIAAEYSNIRGTLEWAFGADGDTAGGTALALALLPFWQEASEGEEGQHWIERSMAHADDAPELAEPPPAASDPRTDDGRTVALLMRRLQSEGVIDDAAVAGIEQAALLALARRLRPGDLRNVDAAFKDLQHAVAIASRLTAPRAAPSPLPPEGQASGLVEAALRQVAAHTRAGEFDHGVDAVEAALAQLADFRRRQLAAIAAAERTLLDAGRQQDLLRRDAFAVARRVEALAALDLADPAERPTWSAGYRAEEARFLDEGYRQAINLALEVGIELVRRRLATAADAAERCDAQRTLGGALAELGDRGTGTEALEEAIGIYEAALAHTPRARAPLVWAALQNDLGAALRLLGLRTGDTATLASAAAACRAALGERRRAEAPLEWAETQHGLGMTLRSLGADEAGRETLEAAVQALKEALKERTPARDPLGYVRTQTGLGVAYSVLGRREAGVASRREAVQAYRAALSVATREHTPLEWATLQNNLGIELASIGEIAGDTGLLHEAVAAYHECLKERTRERAPAYWAASQHNLGGALRVLGEREDDAATLREAVAAFRAALQVHTRERIPSHWAATKNDLGIALLALGRHEDDAALLEEAVRVLRQALEERPRERGPVPWAVTLSDLAQALWALGQARGSVATVRAALTAWEEAAGVFEPDTLPELHAGAQPSLAAARRWMAARGEPVDAGFGDPAGSEGGKDTV